MHQSAFFAMLTVVFKGKVMTKKIIRRLIFVFILVLAVVFGIMHYDKTEYTRDNLDEYVRRMCELSDVPGFSAAIIDGDNEYYINYGEGIDENSRFELASTTKAFTALGILKLEKEGKLSIADPATKYIPWFKPTYKGNAYDITIENLLCHTSGIPVWTITTIPEGDATKEGELTKTIENIKDVKLSSKPGTHHEYATINYDVLGLIIEEVTGEKYEDYITAEILKPIGMENSLFRVSDEKKDECVQGYKTMFLKAHPYDAPSYYGNTAAGYLVSSTSDLMKWIEMWSREGYGTLDYSDVGNEPIEYNSLEKEEKSLGYVFSDIVGETLGHDVSKTDNYYAGWNIYDTYICHGGNNPNFSSQVIIARDRQQGVFALSSLAGSSATRIADGIYRILLGEKLKIGLQIDDNELIDFLSIEFMLLFIYFTLLFWDKKSKASCVKRIAGSAVFIAALVILPVVFHYPLTMIYVWFPFTASIALGVSVILAVINILAGCTWVRQV